jgi:hypothetical protein
MNSESTDSERDVETWSKSMARWLNLPLLAVAIACMSAGVASGGEAEANPSAALLAKYGTLRNQLSSNQFQRPLYLNSSETRSGVTGSIYALIDHPFATTSTALNSPARWCDILMLHLNTKFCRASTKNPGNTLQVNIGKKHDQPVNDSYRVEFAYRVAAASPDYLKVALAAEEGPFSTYDYAISVEAIPLDTNRTLVHLQYSYAYGFVGRVAMQSYLNTVGSSKVGFTITGKQADGQPIYIGGMRGLAERNTMRYYLAIEAFLGALSAPPQERLEKSLHDWFAATELYPSQLHELEQNQYLDMKRKEFVRQRAAIELP